jgi:hypothetical protein
MTHILEEFMRKFLIPALAVLFMACSSAPRTAPVKAPDYVEKTSAYELVDHKAKAVGQEVPDWVTLYISDGIHGVESLPEFQDKYVFVGEDSGSNLNALRQWTSGFTVNQEIARMVSTRVQAKFAGAAAGSPDAEYGRYFEDVVKSVGEASFSGARKENDYWLFKRYFSANRKTVDQTYDFYVLVTIDKPILEQQINNVLNGVRVDQPLTREQETAVDRVKEAFYEGF